MVARRHPALTGTVVKRVRQRPRYARPRVCLWPGCGAELSHDHHEPICSCHVVGNYTLQHDPRSHDLVLHLLVAAYPEAIDLTHILRTSGIAVRNCVAYWRRRHWPIRGSRAGHGYWLELGEDTSRRTLRARTVKP